MSASTIRLPPKLAREVENYRDTYGLEQTGIAARRLIKIGLEQVNKK
jgi:hypothetical protein